MRQSLPSRQNLLRRRLTVDGHSFHFVGAGVAAVLAAFIAGLDLGHAAIKGSILLWQDGAAIIVPQAAKRGG